LRIRFWPISLELGAVFKVIRREFISNTNPLRSVFIVLFPMSILLFGIAWDEHRDPMAVTGTLTVLGGILFGQVVDRDQINTIRKLRDTGLIELEASREKRIMSRLRKNTLWWQVSMAVVILVCTYMAYRNFIPYVRDGFFAASLMCAALIGLRFGRIAANGFTGRALERTSASFQLTIEHPDGTGGLSRIGYFYLLQAGVVFIAASWLTVWIYLIDRGNGYVNEYFYGRWNRYFVILLLICVAVFAFSMVHPMLSFRRMIVSWKAQKRASMSALSGRLYSLNSQVTQDAFSRRNIREISRHLHFFNQISDWGISPLVWTTFFTTFLTLLLSAFSLIVAMTR